MKNSLLNCFCTMREKEVLRSKWPYSKGQEKPRRPHRRRTGKTLQHSRRQERVQLGGHKPVDGSAVMRSAEMGMCPPAEDTVTSYTSDTATQEKETEHRELTPRDTPCRWLKLSPVEPRPVQASSPSVHGDVCICTQRLSSTFPTKQ